MENLKMKINEQIFGYGSQYMKQKEKRGSSPSKHKFTWDIDKNALQMTFEIKIYYSLMNFNFMKWDYFEL